MPSYAHVTDTVAEYDVARHSALSHTLRCLYDTPVNARHAETHLTAATNGQTRRTTGVGSVRSVN